MATQRELLGIAHNIAHHAQSGLSWLHPHLAEACRFALVDAAEVELLDPQPYPLALPRRKPLEGALQDLQTRFWGMLELQGISRDSVQSVRLKFLLSPSRTDNYSCAVTAVITASNGKIFQKHVPISW